MKASDRKDSNKPVIVLNGAVLLSSARLLSPSVKAFSIFLFLGENSLLCCSGSPDGETMTAATDG